MTLVLRPHPSRPSSVFRHAFSTAAIRPPFSGSGRVPKEVIGQIRLGVGCGESLAQCSYYTRVSCLVELCLLSGLRLVGRYVGMREGGGIDEWIGTDDMIGARLAGSCHARASRFFTAALSVRPSVCCCAGPRGLLSSPSVLSPDPEFPLDLPSRIQGSTTLVYLLRIL